MRIALLSLIFTILPISAARAAFNFGGENTVILTGSVHGSNGGAFGVYANRPISGNADFRTFCVELTQTFSPGATYKATLSNSTSTGVELKEEVAWLYHSFLNGNLSVPVTTNLQDAVQYAIWKLMSPSGATIGLSTTDNQAQFDAWFSGWTSTGNFYGVQIMQLTDVDGNGEYQDQLIQVPPSVTATPEPATLAIWGGLATLGFVAQTYRRKS